jgi:transcriptional regulator with XRE-family HTH domain
MPVEDSDALFAAAVKKQRELHGWTQAELAEKVEQYGASFLATTIYKIESGKRKVTVAEAIALAHALRVSVNELIIQGTDSAFAAKEVLLEYGMETLLDHERVVDSLMPMIDRQKRMRDFIAEYREKFDDDPRWLAYRPSSQNLRKHWEPLIEWTGPAEYLASWRALTERTGAKYLSDLGWADDRADPVG